MSSFVARLFGGLFEADKSERYKFIFLTLAYFCVIASYTLVKELKDSIFIRVVGIDYMPKVKIISMLVLIPAILFYSFLVDRLKRHQLLMVYSLIYGFAILAFAYYLGHPTIGMYNTEVDSKRLFGWFFYFLIEGYSPFLVSVFWAFANSITDPNEAKKNYSLMVAGSKLGGMLSAGLAWLYLSKPWILPIGLDEVGRHQLLFAFSAIVLFFVPVVTILLRKKVSSKDLHGYEAAYQFEKAKKEEEKSLKDTVKGFFSGLIMLVRYPYVMGIFGFIFFYEVINVVLSFLRSKVASEASCDLSGLNCILFQQIFFVHFIGFLVALFGTTPLLRKFGEKKCLVFIPIITSFFVFLLLFNLKFFGAGAVGVVSFVFIAIRAINYGISYPVRESLYVPAVKDIKFKSKSWIDAFGTKFAKSVGSAFNLYAPVIAFAHTAFLSVILVFWLITSFLLGRRYEIAIKNKEVIGK